MKNKIKKYFKNLSEQQKIDIDIEHYIEISEYGHLKSLILWLLYYGYFDMSGLKLKNKSRYKDMRLCKINMYTFFREQGNHLEMKQEALFYILDNPIYEDTRNYAIDIQLVKKKVVYTISYVNYNSIVSDENLKIFDDVLACLELDQYDKISPKSWFKKVHYLMMVGSLVFLVMFPQYFYGVYVFAIFYGYYTLMASLAPYFRALLFIKQIGGSQQCVQDRLRFHFIYVGYMGVVTLSSIMSYIFWQQYVVMLVFVIPLLFVFCLSCIPTALNFKVLIRGVFAKNTEGIDVV